MEYFSTEENYSFYLKTMKKIAASGPYKKPTVRGLEIKRAVIQRGYKEIKRLQFPGTLIDFICWISFDFFISILKITWDKKRESIKSSFEILKMSFVAHYKNSERLMVTNPAALAFSLEKMSFSSKKDKQDFGKLIKSLF
jgi:hypothetical protein